MAPDAPAVTLRTLDDEELARQIEAYKARVAGASRGGFLKWARSQGMVAPWPRIAALWGPSPEASEAAKKAAVTRALNEANKHMVAPKPAPPPEPEPESVVKPAIVEMPVPEAPTNGTMIDEIEARKALKALEKDLNGKFLERRDVIAGTIAALIAGEHVLALGPPGTAKTALFVAVKEALGLTGFEYLLTAYTEPPELFGAVDIPALKQGVRRVITDGMLPEAQVAVLDEIFKASSAILNTLLSVINERKFHNGGTPTKVPLISLLAASNEMPQDESLLALFDRLLLRYNVENIRSDENFRKILRAGAPKASVKVSSDALFAAQAGAASVKFSETALTAMVDIRAALKAEGIVASERRWVKTVAVARAFAWLEADAEVTPEHLGFLADALWNEPEQRANVRRIVAAHTNNLLAQCEEIVASAQEYIDNVKRIAEYDRGGSLNEAAKVNTKLDEMTAKLREMEKAAPKRQVANVEDALLKVAAIKTDLVKIVKQGAK